MGVISAIACIAAFIFLALVLGGWATISGSVLGVILIICAALILLDLIWPYARARQASPQ